MIKQVMAFICDRCGHGPWLRNLSKSNKAEADQPELPKICPKCKSPHWNNGPKKKAGV